MKVLLVSDARGVHEYLYRGLTQLGHACEMAVIDYTPLGQVEHAIDFHPLRKLRRPGRMLRPWISLWQLGQLSEYDVISFVHRISVHELASVFQYTDLPGLERKSGILSYTALGCDEISLIKANPMLPYRPCGDCERLDPSGRYCIDVVRKAHDRGRAKLQQHFDVVVSSMVEYDHARTQFRGRSARIPLPVDIGDIPARPAEGGRARLRIIHTPTRKGFKGTGIVLQAMELLAARRADFEFKVVEGLPFDEYTKVVESADIVIDQVWSQSAGMNALWMLGMGKVVFSGNSELCQAYFPFGHENPIIDAPPDPVQLADKLEAVLRERGAIAGLAERGRAYIGTRHNHVGIARDYLEVWQDALPLTRASAASAGAA
jgi:hypothetical protein